jgi:hypothetical protein
MKIKRYIEVEVDVFQLIDGIYQFAAECTKPVICEYMWERLRKAADMMEKTYLEG